MRDGIVITAEVLLVIAVSVPLFLLWIAVIIDLLRRKDLSIVRKAMWAAIVVFTLHIGTLLYFVFRPVPPAAGKRRLNHSEHSSQIVTRLETLHQQHDDGLIADDAYLDAKRELLGLTT